MSTIASTPPRRAHAFINHSPETYEARMRSQQPDVKKEEPGPPQGSRSRSHSKSSISSQSDSESGYNNSSHSPAHSNGSQESQSSSSSQSSSQSNRYLKDAPRKRRRTSPNELHILETEFSQNSKPCKEDRERIASLTSMDEKAVQVWFQNKRQSCRRQQNQGIYPMQAIVRTNSMPASFQDENTFQVGVQPVSLSHKKPLGVSSNTNTPAVEPASAQPTFSVMQQPKSSKSLKLSMSADGKAELVERSPLKQLHVNTQNPRSTPSLGFPMPAASPAMRFATMPAFAPPLSGVEQEIASSLLVLKSGQWR